MKKEKPEIVNDKKKDSWWNLKINSFKNAIRNTKSSFGGMIQNMNIQSAFNDKAVELRIENPEEVLFVGDRIYGIINELENEILFRKTNNAIEKIKVGTMLHHVNTFNHYVVTEIKDDLLFPVVVKDENQTVECMRVLIIKK